MYYSRTIVTPCAPCSHRTVFTVRQIKDGVMYCIVCELKQYECFIIKLNCACVKVEGVGGGGIKTLSSLRCRAAPGNFVKFNHKLFIVK
jgi:hypothetical protein